MTVIMLHPIGLDADSFQFLPVEFGKDLVAFNLLGHGGRPRPSGAVTLEAFADDVVAHTAGPLDIVGVSLGGTVAQYVAVRHPGRVRSLVLAASTAGDGSEERLAENRSRAELTRKGMIAMTEWTLKRWFSQSLLDQPNHPAVDYVKERLLLDEADFVADTWLALGRSDSLRHLPSVTAPTTILHPDQDVSPLAAKETMARALRHSRLVVVPGPHMVHLEEPSAFADAVGSHLSWVDQRSTAPAK